MFFSLIFLILGLVFTFFSFRKMYLYFDEMDLGNYFTIFIGLLFIASSLITIYRQHTQLENIKKELTLKNIESIEFIDCTQGCYMNQYITKKIIKLLTKLEDIQPLVNSFKSLKLSDFSNLSTRLIIIFNLKGGKKRCYSFSVFDSIGIFSKSQNFAIYSIKFIDKGEKFKYKLINESQLSSNSLLETLRKLDLPKEIFKTSINEEQTFIEMITFSKKKNY